MSYKVVDVLFLHKQDETYPSILKKKQRKKKAQRVMFKIFKYNDLHKKEERDDL